MTDNQKMKHQLLTIVVNNAQTLDPPLSHIDFVTELRKKHDGVKHSKVAELLEELTDEGKLTKCYRRKRTFFEGADGQDQLTDAKMRMRDIGQELQPVKPLKIRHIVTFMDNLYDNVKYLGSATPEEIYAEAHWDSGGGIAGYGIVKPNKFVKECLDKLVNEGRVARSGKEYFVSFGEDEE